MNYYYLLSITYVPDPLISIDNPYQNPVGRIMICNLQVKKIGT